MRYPFKFSFASANQVGVIFNPNGVSVTTPVSNAMAPADAPTAVIRDLTIIGTKWRITGLCIQTDSAGVAKCTLGYYSGSTFVGQFPIIATDVSGGGLVCPIDYLIPAGTVPAIKNDAAGAAVVAGDVEVYTQS